MVAQDSDVYKAQQTWSLGKSLLFLEPAGSYSHFPRLLSLFCSHMSPCGPVSQAGPASAIGQGRAGWEAGRGSWDSRSHTRQQTQAPCLMT